MTSIFFGLLGGLGLFLYGMSILSEGLQLIAGERMRRVLAALTDNRFAGLLVGMAVTALLQSSTATTVMVVSFVNAGLMSLLQAIGVIIGANIGTTVTAQLIAFNVARFALPVIGIGVGLRLFGRGETRRQAGQVILGLGLVFFGLAIMKDAFEPLRGNQQFQQLFLSIGDNPLFGVVCGAAMTMLVQSSAATIALTIALATSGLLGYQASLALILGENLGTTLTANLAAIGTSLAARRAALAHLLFNGFGVLIMLLLFPLFTRVVTAVSPGDPDFVIRGLEQVEQLGGAVGDKPFIARHIANAHTLFNVLNALLFLPLVGPLARLTATLLRGRDEAASGHVNRLDLRVLNTPPLALAQSRSEVFRMVGITREMVQESVLLVQEQDLRRVGEIRSREETLDRLHRDISNFLVALSQQSITAEISREVAGLMHISADLERIGDHCMELGRLVQRKEASQIEFSPLARRELTDLTTQVVAFYAGVASALTSSASLPIEQAKLEVSGLDRQIETLRGNHLARLNTGECSVSSGLVFLDLLHNFEKVADHTFKLAKAAVLQPQSGRSGEVG